MVYRIDECDQLRLPDTVCEADPRIRSLVLANKKTGETRTVDDQYQAISGFKLKETVPEKVAIHFETAKNLYLYSWFVYRFYSVAEQQAFSSLEFALRERFPDFVADSKKKHPRGMEPGLKKLLGYAIKESFVRNEDFLARERWAMRRAKLRYKNEKFREAIDQGLESWVVDYSEAVIREEDLNYDWLSDFHEIIPNIRNSHAHGSGLLYPASVNHTFEVVSELINQLYPK